MSLFSSYLKHYRTKNGMSLRGLADVMGVDASILSRLERDEIAAPSEEVLNKLPGAIGRPATEVYLAAQRITPDLATRLERGVPDLLEQMAKLVNEVERHFEGLTQLPPLPLEQLLSPVDAATMKRISGLGEDFGEILGGLMNGQISPDQFEHLVEVIRQLKLICLPPPPQETPDSPAS